MIPSRPKSAQLAHIRAESAVVDHVRILLEAVDHDRAEADHSLGVAQQRVDDLAARQSQLKAHLMHMQESVQALRAEYMQQSLNSCPDDVLRCIFDVAVDSPDEDWATFGSYDHERAVISFTLASVCSRWRRVALGCPTLWTYIGIPTPPLTIAHLNRVHLLLERSTPCGIDIIFDCQWQKYEPLRTNDPLHSCMAALSRHSARWRKAEVWLPVGARPEILHVFRGPPF